MKKGKRVSIFLWSSLSFIILGSVVFGYWKLTGSSVNILTVAAFQNKIVEKYKVPQEVNPGDEIDKTVNVSNTGNVSSFIRVKVTKVFGETKADGTFTEDVTLDPEMIRIHYADTWWTQGKDGYFYYKEILQPGKTTKEPLFQKYQLSENAGNEYQGKDARIIVTMESMQADMDPKEIWGVSVKNLGLKIEQGEEKEKTTVIYQGKNSGFKMTDSTTDLFASFKLLTPGCGRVQKITIENQSEEQVEIFLHAEETTNIATTSTQKTLIQKLLDEEAVIQIKEGNKVLYKGPVSGKSSKGGMGTDQAISLGTFLGKQSRELTVTLSVSPDMEVESGNISAKIKWVFSVKGEDGSTVYTGNVPKTGDTSRTNLWILLLFAGTGGIAAWKIIRKRKDERC